MGAKGKELQAGYPRWSFVPGITHGGFFLTILFGYALYSYFVLHPEGNYRELFWSFLALPWEKLPPNSRYAIEQIFCCINGYFLKDYYLFTGLDTFFLIHHFASIFGCCVCLSFPTGAAYIGLNGVMGEIGSVFYNLKEFTPGPKSISSYYIMMTISNVLCTYFSFQICFNLGVPLPWNIIYGFLALLILILRWYGFVAYINERLQENKQKEVD